MIRETNYDHLFESQQQYRLVLDAMAKPGTVQKLDSDITAPSVINKASAIVGFILMNSDVAFYQDYNVEELNNYFTINTASKAEEASSADFIYISGTSNDTAVIEDAKSGLPEYPEHGAFVVIDVNEISETTIQGGIEIILSGPGVDGQKEIFVSGLSAGMLDALQEKNIEYPLGVDTIFTDKNGNIVCVPRSNKFTYKEQ